MAKMCFIFQPTICMNLWVPEYQITKSTKSHVKLTQANRSITFYKDSDTSLWQSQSNFFK